MPRALREAGHEEALVDWNTAGVRLAEARASSPSVSADADRFPSRASVARDAEDLSGRPASIRAADRTRSRTDELRNRRRARVAAPRDADPSDVAARRDTELRLVDAGVSESAPPRASAPPPRAVAAPPRAAAPPPAAPPPRAAGVPGRRTVTIRGQVDRPVPRRRPSRSPYDRAGNRPDRVAMWAVLLGVLLILVAATSSHAAMIRTASHARAVHADARAAHTAAHTHTRAAHAHIRAARG
jgi:hypothetical protein